MTTSVGGEDTGPAKRGGAALLRSSFGILALIYAALFCAFGTEGPFLPSFLLSRGLTAPEIALVLAAGTLVRLAAGPLIGLAADRIGTRFMLAMAALGAGAICTLYLAASQFPSLLTISMLHSLATCSLNPLADTLALTASLREGAFAYGWVRGVGSGSFVVGTLLSGQLVGRFGLESIIAASSVFFALVAVPIPLLRRGAAPPLARGSRVADDLRALRQQPLFLRMLLVAGLIIGSQAMSDTFAVIRWQAAGVSPGTIGALLAEAVLSETAVFVFAGPFLLRRLGVANCATLSAVAGVVRWATLAVTTNVAALAATEVLHGLTFSLVHLTCMDVIAGCVPKHLSATGQSLYGTLCLGLASALVTLAAGPLYEHFGARGFFGMALICAVAVPVARSVGGGNHAAIGV